MDANYVSCILQKIIQPFIFGVADLFHIEIFFIISGNIDLDPVFYNRKKCKITFTKNNSKLLTSEIKHRKSDPLGGQIFCPWMYCRGMGWPSTPSETLIFVLTLMFLFFSGIWWIQDLVDPGSGGSRIWWIQDLVDPGSGGSGIWWIRDLVDLVDLVDPGSGGSYFDKLHFLVFFYVSIHYFLLVRLKLYYWIYLSYTLTDKH